MAYASCSTRALTIPEIQRWLEELRLEYGERVDSAIVGPSGVLRRACLRHRELDLTRHPQTGAYSNFWLLSGNLLKIQAACRKSLSAERRAATNGSRMGTC